MNCWRSLIRESALKKTPHQAVALRVPPRTSSFLTAGALAVVIVLALALRLRDLHLGQGTLSSDEARLTLVAHGIVEHGWPVLPSGHSYTRGLAQAFLTAASVAMFGAGDFAPRLPSVLSGVLLVAVMYFYGSSLAGRHAGILAAALTATYAPLVIWSRQAWFYSTFVLVWLVALCLFDRAVATGSRRALLLGAGALVLGLFTHELAVLLLPSAALALIWWLRGYSKRPGSRASALAAMTLLSAGLALLAALTLTLRSDTVAGPLGEIDEYLSPPGNLRGLLFYGNMLVQQHWLLLTVGVTGWFLGQRGLRLRLLLPLIAMVFVFVVIAFLLSPPPEQRYGLALMPPLFLLAAAGAATVTTRLHRRTPRPLALVAAAALYLAMLAPHLDLRATLRRSAIPDEDGSWMVDLYTHGYEPNHLVLTDVPTVVFLYLGRTDFWLRSRGYEKYTYAPDGVWRDIHTGAVLVRSVEDFERRVRSPHGGHTAWVIGSNLPWQWQSATDRDLREYFEAHAVQRLRPRDNTRLYMLRL
jgi:dolichyl-phosphate-mannose-protein mannosyltransferase